jgi:V/A-type H+/Na+-transporting ATPase subunit K
MKKAIIIIIAFLIMASFSLALSAQEDKKETAVIEKQSTDMKDLGRYIGAAIAMGAAALGAGIGIGRIGAAAMGAISEKPEVGGMGIILAGLAEGICLWGFLIAIFILMQK